MIDGFGGADDLVGAALELEVLNNFHEDGISTCCIEGSEQYLVLVQGVPDPALCHCLAGNNVHVVNKGILGAPLRQHGLDERRPVFSSAVIYKQHLKMRAPNGGRVFNRCGSWCRRWVLASPSSFDGGECFTQPGIVPFIGE